MPFIAALMSLLVPFAAHVDDRGADDVAHQARVEGRGESGGPLSTRPLSSRSVDWFGVVDATRPPVANQVRIESRVILRISPAPGAVRNTFMTEMPRPAMPPRLVERPGGKCIPAGGIVGVSDRGNRLVFYMRDRSMISARLEKACSPRDFYLGFYMEKSDDGQLCIGRDRLESRAGAKCQVSELNRLMLLAD